MKDTPEATPLFFESHEVRMIEFDGKPWWALPDVGRVLGLTQPQNFLSSPWCSKDGVCLKYLIDSMGRRQRTTLIDEPNLYALVLRSDKPVALEFHRWITGVVLPEIRRTGEFRRAEADEYRRLLALFVPGELRPWEKSFPDEFFREMCRLNGWRYNEGTHRTTGSLGKVIRDIVYDRLPEGVLEKLDALNPADPKTGRRSKRHHQLLAQEIAEHIKERLRALVAMAKAEASYADFKARVDATFPKPGRQMTLPGTLGRSLGRG